MRKSQLSKNCAGRSRAHRHRQCWPRARRRAPGDTLRGYLIIRSILQTGLLSLKSATAHCE